MTKLEELRAALATAEDATDAAWDDVDAACEAAYAADIAREDAYDARNAYEAELKKQKEK